MFILISLAIEYLAILISCAVAILILCLMPTIEAIINGITLDWASRLRIQKKPVAEVMRLGALMTNEEAV